MLFRRKATDSGDPRQVWIEELLGPELPEQGAARDEMIARLLAGGGKKTFRELRGGANPAPAR